mmetsp:Transcript_20245/g.44730  ORF Transcript_20245/g.44730 Transcript_20245/m.44730 type:complete len:325 (+) Transcript_20245:1392-2366(+)
MWAVRHCTLQHVVQGLGVAVLRLQLCQPQPETLLALQMHHCIVVDGSCNLDGVSVDCSICILDPVLFHALHVLIHTHLDGDLDDRLAGLDEACLLSLLCLFQPHVAVRCDTVGRQGIDGAGQDQLHHLLVALCLFQFGSGHPNHGTGRDVFARFVQDFLSVLVSRQLRQSQPHFHGVRHTFHGAAQHHTGFGLVLQTHGLLPQTDGVGNELQRLPQHPTFRLQVRLSVRRIDPQTHAVRQGFHRLGQHGLGVGRLFQAGGLKPNILVVGAMLAPLGNQLSSGLHLTSYLFQTSRGDPTGSVLRIAGDHTLQQRSGLLNVADIGI